MEKIAEALICFAPTVWEIYNDRNGETANDKVRDGIITAIFYTTITLALWWVYETHPLKLLALMLGIRVMFFDYFIQYILTKRGVIRGHWFFYKGHTAKFDRVIKYLNPWIVLVCRVILFAAAVWLTRI